jgi:hypothetical protein
VIESKRARGLVDTKRATQLKECGWRSKAKANLRRRWDFEIHIRDAVPIEVVYRRVSCWNVGERRSMSGSEGQGAHRFWCLHSSPDFSPNFPAIEINLI